VVNQVAKQVRAFIEGLWQVVSLQCLKKFTAEELRSMAEGSDKVSVAELKEHTSIYVE
jgi:hypothetical protein